MLTVPHLLFVCVENSCRSQMAEGFAREAAPGRVSVHSAGSRPSGQIDPRAVAFMRERGIDLTPQLSKGLDDLPPGISWDVIVTMGCGDACPHLPASTRLDWDLPDPKPMSDDDFRRVRDRIESMVGDLVERVSSGEPPKRRRT
jgi:protein-tyrosine-phosphatase